MPQFGLGNIVQTTPAVRFLAEKHAGEIAIVSTPRTVGYIDAVFGRRYRVTNEKPLGHFFRSCVPTDFSRGGFVSEVQRNLQIVGAPAGDEHRVGFIERHDSAEEFDIVICNGYNKTLNHVDWKVKEYPHWAHVAGQFNLSHRVASVGLHGEHVAGTIDRTGIGLRKTLGLLQRAKVVVANDTGLYHAAAAMQIPTVVVFTMTDRTKNFDPVFHRSAIPVHTMLACQPCQLRGHHFWLKERPKCQWACQQVPPEHVINSIINAMKEPRA